MGVPGSATEEGTRRYTQRFAGRVAEGHFRRTPLGWLSSIGIGTYLGEPDSDTDQRYTQAVAQAVARGANVVDTAINYRFQRSERSVGAALARLLAEKQLARDEVVIATKAGFLTFDGEPPRDPSRYFDETYVRKGIITSQEDVIGGMHCMTPRYLEDQLARSRRNLNLETIDIYYLHNPETQLQVLKREQFLERVRAAFQALESFVAAGKIRAYGMATWNGYRQQPQARDFLSLAELVHLAEDVGGKNHHFRALQLPYNLAMPEAFFRANQPLDSRRASLLEAAQQFGLTVFASASILQGQILARLPEELRAALQGLETDAQRAIQFVRSTPGVTTALVGMSRPEHVEENLRLAAHPPLGREQFLQLFTTKE